MEQSGGRSRVLCWELVGLVCFAGGDTSKQGKSREIKGNGRRRWRGVGPAGRPSLFPFGVSVILKSDRDMTKEEAKERFGDNIINKLLSLGAEPTNVCRNDDIVEWCSDGCIKVGDIEVWAYYYFYEGENPDLCNWEDRMEIDVEECWI